MIGVGPCRDSVKKVGLRLALRTNQSRIPPTKHFTRGHFMAGLLFRAQTQIQVAAELRHKGYGFFEARRLAQSVDEDTIQLAVAMCPPDVKAATVGAFGDGSLIKIITDFFKSEQGQALIAALVKLILGLLV